MVVVHFRNDRSPLGALLLWGASIKAEGAVDDTTADVVKGSLLTLTSSATEGSPPAKKSLATLLRISVALEIDGHMLRHERLALKQAVRASARSSASGDALTRTQLTPLSHLPGPVVTRQQAARTIDAATGLVDLAEQATPPHVLIARAATPSRPIAQPTA